MVCALDGRSNAGPGQPDRYDVYQTTQFGVPMAGALVLSNAEFVRASGSISSYYGMAEAVSPSRTSMPVWVDTIYVDYGGVNLGNPIPEPVAASASGQSAGVICVIAACCARRRSGL